MSENNKNTNNNDNKISTYDKLVVDIRNNLTTRLTDLMSELLNSTQNNLFDMSEAADNNEDQTRYFELTNQLRALKPTIASTFDSKIRELLIPAKEYEARQAKHKADEEDDELSLVGQDEMEGIVLVKGIGERADSKYREQLQHLEARLEHLALKTGTIFTKDALVPTNFCQAFDDALGDDFDGTNKKLLFAMFEIEIANKLNGLYDSINNRLIDAGVLPQIKLHKQKQKPSRPRPQPQADTNEAADAAQQHDSADGYAGDAGYAGTGGGYTGSGGTGGAMAGGGTGSMAQAGGSGGAGPAGSGVAGAPGGAGMTGGGMGGNNIGGFAMTAAPGGGYHHANQSSLQSQSNGAGAEGGPATHPGTGGPAGQGANANNTYSDRQNSSAGGTEYQHYTAGMPANQVGRVLGNYIGGTPFTPGTADKSSANHGDFFPESTAQHFGHQEIIHALSGIQNLPQFTQPQEARFDAEAIKQAVLAEIAKTSGGAVTKRINQIAEKTIDFIELIFDAIVDDEEISDTIKTLLLRLQIPIIKASMVDQEFFIYDDHPARVLLDTIADVGVGVTDHSDEMYIQLDKIISNILGEYELTIDTFQTALDDLNTIVEEQEAAARAIEEEEQQQVLRKHARATVLKTIRAITTGKTLPEAVHPLIRKR